MAKQCEFCEQKVEDNHICQKELETRLITFHGINENIMAKAAELKSLYRGGNPVATADAIEALLDAIEPLNVAHGSHFATLVVKQMRAAHDVAKTAADEKQHHHLSGKIQRYKTDRDNYGTDAIEYLLNGRKDPGKPGRGKNG